MPRPARIYTRTGDDGTTGLVGGQRRAQKQRAHRLLRRHRRVFVDDRDRSHRALGCRTRCAIRSARSLAQRGRKTCSSISARRSRRCRKTSAAKCRRCSQSDIDALETSIDRSATDELPPLTQFIHPGGTPAGAALHLARAVCRRAERAMADSTATSPSIRSCANSSTDCPTRSSCGRDGRTI